MTAHVDHQPQPAVPNSYECGSTLQQSVVSDEEVRRQSD